jgi:hypothetical protein
MELLDLVFEHNPFHQARLGGQAFTVGVRGPTAVADGRDRPRRRPVGARRAPRGPDHAIEKGDAPRAERATKEHLLYLSDVLRIVET